MQPNNRFMLQWQEFCFEDVFSDPTVWCTGWRSFDDHEVFTAGEHEVCKKNAYVLMYHRRRTPTGHTWCWQTETAAHQVLCSKRAEEVKSYKLEVWKAPKSFIPWKYLPHPRIPPIYTRCLNQLKIHQTDSSMWVVSPCWPIVATYKPSGFRPLGVSLCV